MHWLYNYIHAFSWHWPNYSYGWIIDYGYYFTHATVAVVAAPAAVSITKNSLLKSGLRAVKLKRGHDVNESAQISLSSQARFNFACSFDVANFRKRLVFHSMTKNYNTAPSDEKVTTTRFRQLQRDENPPWFHVKYKFPLYFGTFATCMLFSRFRRPASRTTKRSAS